MWQHVQGLHGSIQMGPSTETKSRQVIITNQKLFISKRLTMDVQITITESPGLPVNGLNKVNLIVAWREFISHDDFSVQLFLKFLIVL